MSDGYQVRARYWPAARLGPTPVLYLHGVQSHGGWYEWSGSLIAELTGAAVLMPDRRGSGLCWSDRGDVHSAKRWLSDLTFQAAWLRHQSAAARVRVVGVSWGGKLAVAWALRKPSSTQDLLLVAPGIVPQVDIGRAARLRVALAWLAGGGSRFPLPLADAALFTDNPLGQQFIDGDPLKLTHVTARFLKASNDLDLQIRWAAPGKLKPAALLLLAEKDRIIDSRRTETVLRRLSRSCQVRTLPGAHTLEFDADPAAFQREIRTWCDRPGCAGVDLVTPSAVGPGMTAL